MNIAACIAVASCLGAWPPVSASQESEQIYKPGDGVSQPVLVKQVAVPYTPEAMREGIQGAVQIHCVVRTTGMPDHVKVSRSLDPRLDAAAVKAVEPWRFKPGLKDGKPVAVQIEIVVGFGLAPPPKTRVYTPGKGVSTPIASTRVQPPYPKEAMGAGVQGKVRLECVVNIDGTPNDIVVTRPLYPPLDEAAIQALKQWRFKPGQKDKRAVPVRIEVEITFKMR